AVLTASFSGTPTKVYDGTTTATVATILLNGFAAGENAPTTQPSGSYASANVSGTDLVTVALSAAADFAADPGTLLTNYVLPTLVPTRRSSDLAVLTASFSGTPTKVYDGTTTATVATILLNGFAA